MRPRKSFVLFVLLALIGTATWASASVLPRGTRLNIRTTQPIFADDVRPGSRIAGVVYRPVTVGRRVIIPNGARATLQVVDRSRNANRIDLTVSSIRVGRNRYIVPTNDVRLGGSSTGSRRPRRGVVGGIGGAVAGGMLGGGTGAALGATTGAGVGMVSAGRGRSQLAVPSNTRLQFRAR
jgi:hypothetical protein